MAPWLSKPIILKLKMAAASPSSYWQYAKDSEKKIVLYTGNTNFVIPNNQRLYLDQPRRVSEKISGSIHNPFSSTMMIMAHSLITKDLVNQ